MTHVSQQPTFGRRGSPRPAGETARRSSSVANVAAASPDAGTPPAVADHAAFFASVRQEIDGQTPRPRKVPRSFGAALMAGLVVGFCLAGLDVTQATATLHRLAGATGADTARWLPMMILAALASGARAAATSLLIAHAALKALALTSHLAYAVAGGAVAAIFAVGTSALVQAGVMDGAIVPGHGLAIDIMAGAAAGALYRMFAGAPFA